MMNLHRIQNEFDLREMLLNESMFLIPLILEDYEEVLLGHYRLLLNLREKYSFCF